MTPALIIQRGLAIGATSFLMAASAMWSMESGMRYSSTLVGMHIIAASSHGPCLPILCRAQLLTLLSKLSGQRPVELATPKERTRTLPFTGRADIMERLGSMVSFLVPHAEMKWPHTGARASEQAWRPHC